MVICYENENYGNGIALGEFEVMDVVHGKDSMKLLTVQFRNLGATDLRDAASLIWTACKREIIDDFPTLREIMGYLNGFDPKVAS